MVGKVHQLFEKIEPGMVELWLLAPSLPRLKIWMEALTDAMDHKDVSKL